MVSLTDRQNDWQSQPRRFGKIGGNKFLRFVSILLLSSYVSFGDAHTGNERSSRRRQLMMGGKGKGGLRNIFDQESSKSASKSFTASPIALPSEKSQSEKSKKGAKSKKSKMPQLPPQPSSPPTQVPIAQSKKSSKKGKGMSSHKSAKDSSKEGNGKNGKGKAGSKNSKGKAGSKNGKGKAGSKNGKGKAGSKKGSKKGSKNSSKKSAKNPTETPSVAPPSEIPTRRPEETSLPSAPPTPQMVSPTLGPTMTPIVTSSPTPGVSTDAPTAVPITSEPTPVSATDVPTSAPVSNEPTPGVATGEPTSAPSISSSAPTPAIATGVPTPAGSTSAPTPLGDTGAPTPAAIGTGAPTPAVGTGAPTAGVGTGVPTPAVASGAPTPAVGTAVPTPTFSTGSPTAAGTSAPTPTSMTAAPTPTDTTSAPTPTTMTAAPTPTDVTSVPTPSIATEVPTPATTTVNPTESPTISGMLGGPTSSPTMPPSFGNDVPATPFDDTFIGADPNPTMEEFEDAEVRVCTFLREYFVAFYAFSFETTLDSVSCEATEFGSEPARIAFAVTLSFSDDSFLIPAQADIDVLLETAFEPPAVDAVLASLAESVGAFSTTTAIEYSVNVSVEAGPLRLGRNRSPLRSIPTLLGSSSQAESLVATEGIAVSGSSFSVVYEVQGADVSELYFKDAKRITFAYLQQFLKNFVDSGFDGDFEFETLWGAALEQTLDPPRVDYNLTASFITGVESVPSGDEFDGMLQAAFLQPTVQALILELRTLPDENPFSSTSSASYSTTTVVDEPNEHTVSIVLIGMAAGFGSLAFITLAMLTTRQTPRYSFVKEAPFDKGGMPSSSNLMAFMDSDASTCRSFASDESIYSKLRNEI